MKSGPFTFPIEAWIFLCSVHSLQKVKKTTVNKKKDIRGDVLLY